VLTLDSFAGGGGASVGIEAALGRSPDVAINHDEHAIAMHAINHPKTRHLRQDVWSVDLKREVDGPLGFAWFSPTCTHFSRAKGAALLDTKTRGLAWFVLRVAGTKRPPLMMLENVSEFQTWGPLNRRRRPIKAKAGITFDRFVSQLRALGYVVEWRTLDAADYGAPTHRKRLFMVMRHDGEPIRWPSPTHGPGRLPYRTAAECVDWSIPCPSIFDRKKPHADATQRRLAEGIRRYVLNGTPYIVGDGAHCLVQTGYGERKGQRPRALDLQAPLGTVVAGGAKHALVTAWLIKHYGGVVGHDVHRPLGTITTQDHHGVVACHLTQYNGQSVGQPLDEPLRTVTTKARFGLVQTWLTQHLGEGPHVATVKGERYQIADIGMRMLSPRELATAQGFGPDYILTGTQSQQIARVGNSVSPPVAEALIRANVRAERQQDLFRAVS
jgi:DNA (cytosine-5)-methyltransferase 1